MSLNSSGVLTAKMIRDAVQKIRDSTWTVPEPPVMSPRLHNYLNDALDRPHGTPMTYRDYMRAQEILYDRMTPDERAEIARLMFQMMGTVGW